MLNTSSTFPYSLFNVFIFKYCCTILNLQGCKKGRKPTTKPTLYKLKIEPENIIMHNNFPFEFQIKKGVKVEKVNNVEELLKLSKKMSKIFDKICM